MALYAMYLGSAPLQRTLGSMMLHSQFKVEEVSSIS